MLFTHIKISKFDFKSFKSISLEQIVCTHLITSSTLFVIIYCPFCLFVCLFIPVFHLFIIDAAALDNANFLTCDVVCIAVLIKSCKNKGKLGNGNLTSFLQLPIIAVNNKVISTESASYNHNK